MTAGEEEGLSLASTSTVSANLTDFFAGAELGLEVRESSELCLLLESPPKAAEGR